MPRSGHVHQMAPLAWTSEGSPVLVLLSCQAGICAKTEVARPTKRSRRLLPGMTREQFDRLREGEHWPGVAGPDDPPNRWRALGGGACHHPTPCKTCDLLRD